jgi:RND superfamily putative drug exporter
VVATGRVITSAAIIMIAVFASFILAPDPTTKLFGVGLAVAVLLDVTLVRMVLVPAAMTVLGDSAWWLPGRWRRWLPPVDLDSTSGSDPGRGVGRSAVTASAHAGTDDELESVGRTQR